MSWTPGVRRCCCMFLQMASKPLLCRSRHRLFGDRRYHRDVAQLVYTWACPRQAVQQRGTLLCSILEHIHADMSLHPTHSCAHCPVTVRTAPRRALAGTFRRCRRSCGTRASCTSATSACTSSPRAHRCEHASLIWHAFRCIRLACVASWWLGTWPLFCWLAAPWMQFQATYRRMHSPRSCETCVGI